MRKKEIILEAVLSAIFGSIITATLDPLSELFANKLTFQYISSENVLAILGIAAIVGLSITTYSLILKWKNRKKIDNKVSAEDHLNRLIHEIKYFIRKWRKTVFLRLCYRREIERRSMWGNRFRVGKHAQDILNTNKSLKNSLGQTEVMINIDLFDSIDGNINRMIDLGSELEFLFDETQKSINETESSKIKALVSEGDNICENFRNIIPKLEKLRKRIP